MLQLRVDDLYVLNYKLFNSCLGLFPILTSNVSNKQFENVNACFFLSNSKISIKKLSQRVLSNLLYLLFWHIFEIFIRFRKKNRYEFSFTL